MVQVIDASVAVAWCATTQATRLTDASFELAAEQGGHVPSQFWFEVLHALARLERRGVVDPVEVDQFIEKLASLSLIIHASHTAAEMVRLYQMSRQHALSIYDTAYLDLVLRTNVPLATQDDRLARAAARAGARIFGA